MNKHLCQLQGKEKEDFLNELRDVVRRLQALEPRHENRFDPEEIPECLKRRVPRFKPNPDLVPLVTNIPVIEVRPSINARLVEKSDDPKTIYMMMDPPKNPFQSDAPNDSLCQAYCDTVRARQPQTRCAMGQEKPAMFQKPPGGGVLGPGGSACECEQGPVPGVMICKPKPGTQHYLCNTHL